MEVRRLIIEGLGEHFGFIDESLNSDIDDIMGNYIERGHVFVVGLIEERIDATGGLLIDTIQRTGQLVRVSVCPEHRRKGIGVAITRHLIERARSIGMMCVRLETNLDWHAAISLYKQCGFVEYNRDRIGVYMQLDLTNPSPVSGCTHAI